MQTSEVYKTVAIVAPDSGLTARIPAERPFTSSRAGWRLV